LPLIRRVTIQSSLSPVRANDLLTGAEVEAARPAIAASSVLVCQLEIPLDISLAALRIARQEGVKTIFNPAPALSEIPQEFYHLSDIFCPNETETELLTGRSVESQEEAAKAAKVLIERGAASVILTLGERGSLLVTGETSEHVGARQSAGYHRCRRRICWQPGFFSGSWKIFVGFHQTSQRDCSRQRAIIRNPDQFSGSRGSAIGTDLRF